MPPQKPENPQRRRRLLHAHHHRRPLNKNSDVEPDEGHELFGGPLPGELDPRAVAHHRRDHVGSHREVREGTIFPYRCPDPAPPPANLHVAMVSAK